MSAEEKRDFNLAAKIILGLSILSLATGAFSSFQHLSLYSKLGYGGNQTHILIEAIINLLMIGAAIMIFAKKRIGLIAFLVLGVVRMFATIPTGTDISTSYYLGGKTVLFLRDVGIFCIAMCFKKNGISGWRAFFADDAFIEENYVDRSTGSDITTAKEPIIEEPSTKQEPIIVPESANVIEEKQIVETDSASHQIVEPSRGPVVETKARRPINWGKTLLFLIPSVILLGVIVMAIIISSGNDYNANSTSFADKFKEYFDMPNNKKAAEFLDKGQQAYERQLYELSLESAQTSYYYNPSKLNLIKELCILFRKLSFEVDNSKICQERAISIAKEYLRKDPNNVEVMENLCWMQFNNGDVDESIKVAQDILYIEDNSTAIGIMGRRFYQKENWDELLKWSERGIMVDSTLAEHHYMKAKALKEKGNLEKAYEEFVIGAKLYDEHFLYKELSALKPPKNKVVEKQDVVPKVEGLAGKQAITVKSISISNTTHEGTYIDKPGSNLYDDNTRYLQAQVSYTPYVIRPLTIYVKLYANGSLQRGASSPSGYTTKVNVQPAGILADGSFIVRWGGDKPGYWNDGGYRYEFYLDGEKIASKEFNVYSGFWHRVNGENRFD